MRKKALGFVLLGKSRNVVFNYYIIFVKTSIERDFSTCLLGVFGMLPTNERISLLLINEQRI